MTAHDFAGYTWQHRIQVVSCGPLVYVRNLKCGSTGYYNFFHNRLRWAEINFMDIDWDTQTVFGHIMDPFVRRCKGIAEYLEMKHLVDLYYADPVFQDMVRTIPCADQHSMSYHDTFGKREMKLIYWIPMVGGFDETHARLEKFLTLHSIRQSNIVDKWFNRHEGSASKKSLSQDLYQHWDSHHQELDIVKWYLQKDYKLWKSVLGMHGL